MADLNEVRLIGRLTRDPETRMTQSGSQVGTLGMATNRRYKGPDGALKEETTFIDITCWGKTAELAAKYLRKGRQVFVAGRLKLDAWEDKQTGQRRSKLSVVADNIQFLDQVAREGGEAQAAPRQAAPQQSQTSHFPPPPEWGEQEILEEPPF